MPIKFTLRNLLYAALCCTIFHSCEDEPVTYNNLPEGLSGVFIVNEGAFLQGNGSISFKSSDSSYFNNDLYLTSNNAPLGDVVQSMSIYNNKGYICVNNSQKLVVVDMKDFKKQSSITIGSPRYFMGFGKIGFVTDWSDNSVKVIDLASNTIKKSIACGNGPEQMTLFAERIYVCNSGGFLTDSTITVINESLSIIDTINTGVNPSSIKLDANAKLWVLCAGTTGPDFTPATADDIGGKLLQIDPVTHAILKTFDFNQSEHPVKLQMDAEREYLYFLLGTSGYTGNVMRMHISDNTLPSTAFVNREFYGLGISTTDEIYGGVASFSANSVTLHYGSNGVLVDSMAVGIGPNGFVFN